MITPRLVNLLIGAYIVIQALYPIRGFLKDKFDTWGRFTWNMYTMMYQCRAEYHVVDAGGGSQPENVERYFTRGDKRGNVYHRDALPGFHKFLCAEVARRGTGGRLRGEIACTANETESGNLISDGGDLCKAPNYGVPVR